MQIRDLILKGVSRKQIAARLFVSPSTVDQHIMAIYRRLAVHSIGELAAKYGEQSKSDVSLALQRLDQRLKRIEERLKSIIT